MASKKTSIKVSVIEYLCCLLAAFVFVSLLGDATSPFKEKDIVVWDASIFQEIGYQWANGNIPYVCTWDHKGPLIFFTNALGFLLTGDKTGVFFIEILLISLFFLFTFHTFLLRFPRIKAFLLTMLSACFIAGLYAGGDNVEELLLPFWALSVYQTIRWLDSFSSSTPGYYNPWNAFLIGVIFSIGFLTRLTNAAGACGIFAVVCCILLKHHRWKELILSVTLFLVGVSCLLLPFFVYFYQHDALDQMLFATIGINISYTTHDIVYPLRKYASNLFCGFSYFGTILFSIALYFIDKEKRPWAIVWFISSLLMALWMFPGRQFTKYVLNCIPYFPVVIIELFDLKKKKLIPSFVACAAMSVFSLILLSNVRFIHPFREAPYIEDLAEAVNQDIPKEDLNYLMGYGFSAQLYLLFDITPCYKNIVSQESHATLSDCIKNDIIQDFSTAKAKWIIAQGETTLIQETLDTKYELIHLYPHFGNNARLYRRLF